MTLVPYLAAADGTRLFEDAGKSRQLDLVSSTAFNNGMIGLQYRDPLDEAAKPNEGSSRSEGAFDRFVGANGRTAVRTPGRPRRSGREEAGASYIGLTSWK